MPYYGKRRLPKTSGSTRGDSRRRYKRDSKAKKTLASKVRRIAKSEVLRHAELKYFNTQTINQLTNLGPATPRVIGENVSTDIRVIGFALGTGEQRAGASSAFYGMHLSGGNWLSNVINPLLCARPFLSTGNESKSPNQIDGKWVKPTSPKTDWIIERPAVNTTDELMALPMFVRFIRVVPKAKKYSDTELDPRYDLFTNQWGIEAGIANTSFQKHELMTYGINTAKYTVLEDMKTVMNPPIGTAKTDIADGTTASTSINSNSCLRFTRYHKQNPKLHYAEEDDQLPDNGQSAEMMFLHTTLLGNITPDISTDLTVANAVTVSVAPVAKFYDM